jgi:hypothetical protein
MPIPNQEQNPVQEIQKDIQQTQKELSDAYKTLNQINPAAAQGGAPVLNTPAVGFSGMPGSPQVGGPGLAAVQNLLANPSLQKYVKVISDPVIDQDLNALLQHPAIKECLYWELGWFVFILFFRAWRVSKATHWSKKIWIYIWTFGLLWAGLLFFVPKLIIGDTYTKFGIDTIQILRNSS